MGKLHLVVVVMVLFGLHQPATAKSLGNFKSYRQITDKEVLIESTKGAFILVSAYNEYALGISVVNEDKVLELTAPNKINLKEELNGSIYVEELDDLMQITTTINNGVAIKIEKNPLHFSYIDKSTRNTLFEELHSVKFKNKADDIAFSLSEDEEIKLVTNNRYETISTNLVSGDVFSFEKMNNLVFPNNEICLVSSKGYAIIFDSEMPHEIDLSKPDQIKISRTVNENKQFNYMLVYGPRCPELIEKYAFHIAPNDKQITLK